MPGRVGVFGRMPVGRAVAAQGDPALLADAQVNPFRTDLHTLGTFLLDRVLYRFDRTNVCTATVAAHELLYSAIARSTAAIAMESGATCEDADTHCNYIPSGTPPWRLHHPDRGPQFRPSERHKERPRPNLAAAAARQLGGYLRHAPHVGADSRQARSEIVTAHQPLLEHRSPGDVTRSRYAAAHGRTSHRHHHARLCRASTPFRVLGRARRQHLARVAAGRRVLSTRPGGAG